MKAILLLFDSLNRHCLEPYGCDWTHTPNFRRLAERSVRFDRCYAGSLPCMPARRELHTGRYNFLHRSWGPVEPYDDSMPELLKKNGVYTHLISDHQHYWEDGGATYHTRYSSWECVRGQEGDPWKAQVADVDIPPHLGQAGRQDEVNRQYFGSAEQQRTVSAAIEQVCGGAPRLRGAVGDFTAPEENTAEEAAEQQQTPENDENQQNPPEPRQGSLF